MNYLKRLKNSKKSIFFIVLTMVVIVLGVSLLMPQYYGSEARLLIIQKQTTGLDAYLAAKSAEKVGNMFSEVIYSTSFFEKVWQAGFNIGNDWGNTERERRELWQERIELNVIPQTSLLELKTYGKDRVQAEQLAQAVIFVMTQKSGEYYGDVDEVDVKLIDKPITSKYPVKPNLLVNGLEALLVGFVLALVYVYLRPVRKNEEWQV